MKKIELVDANGNRRKVTLDGESTVKELIEAAFIGGDIYSSPRYRITIDGETVQWQSVITERNSIVAVNLISGKR